MSESHEELMKILKNKSISTVFQPIVDIRNAKLLGYEALSRGPKGSILEMPDQMFEAARRHDMVWDLELLCRSLAIERACSMQLDKSLFINVDPMIIRDPKFKEGFTSGIIKANGLDTSNIIFEITEKTAVEDYKAFRETLNHYIKQGYKIAIDDTGAGYSGMRLITETKPQFIKLDMELIRDIDKDSFKQAMCKNLIGLSSITNMKLIAEGVENINELNTLLILGVEYVQGYYLGRPSEILIDISEEIKEHILNLNSEKSKLIFYTSMTFPVGRIARIDDPILLSAKGNDVKSYFEKKNVQGVTVVKNSKPVGLIMKGSFNEMLAMPYGNAVYLNRSAELLINKNPLIVDYSVPITEVSKLAMSRPEDNLYDYIIITKEDRYYGIVTVKRLLENTTELELNYARHLNPLTGLPGNIAIEDKLNQAINNDQSVAVLYLDLDNFKAYNDIYGFENGDKILKLAADILTDCTYRHFGIKSFISHIGGDDFIVIVENDSHRVKRLCTDIITVFDKAIGGFYNLEHRNKGFIVSKDRYGNIRKFNIMSLSIAVLCGLGHNLRTPYHAGKLAANLKEECKKECISNYMIRNIEG